MLEYNAARQRLAAFGQEQVLRWFDQLSAAGQARLLAQVSALDLPWLQRALAAAPQAVCPQQIRPYREVVRLGDPAEAQARAAGELALRQGRVGTLLVAGGQGTRLGFAGPKGAFPLGAVSGRSLYQMHAERLVALGRRYGRVPPLYLMTSDANHQDTVALFAEQQNFGLPAEGVLIFQQGLAPAVDEQGKLLLGAPDQLVLSPNGNGGLFAALAQSGALAQMEQLGVETISYIQVDNPLARSCDPRFVGHHLLRQSEFSCKAIAKRGPTEKVGCYALVQGRLRIVEYTELPPALAEQREQSGELSYGFANPGLFVWSRSFLAAQAARQDLPYHKAHKKIPHLDSSGQLVRPDQPCGYKLEAFAMDTLPDAARALVLECRREQEFAPVKNGSGEDSPQTARAQLTALYASWVAQAGGSVAAGAQLEVSPLCALDAEELARQLPAGFAVQGDLFLSEPLSEARR